MTVAGMPVFNTIGLAAIAARFKWRTGLVYGCSMVLIATLCKADSSLFSFSGPEVLKLDWGTRALNVSDVNQDGANDLVLINNDTAQIEVLYQIIEGAATRHAKTRLNHNRWEPLLEDAGFEREGITVGFPLFDLSVGDLNGDGRDDLAYTAREVPLTIRYQNELGHWTDASEVDSFTALGWTDTVQIADIDADGHAELIVIAADAVRIFYQDAHEPLGEPDLYYVTGENPFNLLVEDVTQDGRKDLLYITSNGEQSLALREQLPGGGFGPERRFVFERPVRSVRAMPRTDPAGVSFCAVDSRSGGLEFFRLEHAHTGQAIAAFSAEQPEIYPLFKPGRSVANYALGDLNGDGSQDLLVANPAAAELVLFLKTSGHFHSPQTFPSFSAISSMASGRFFEAAQETVVVVSAAEKAIGLTQIDPSGRMSFPRPLIIEPGDPLVCQTVDLDADGYDELVLVSEVQGEISLALARPADRTNPESDWDLLARTVLSDVNRKPSAIREVAIFEGNRSGLIVFVPREAPILVAIDETAGLELTEIAQASTVRESLLKGLQPVQVSVFDIDEDGVNELIVGREGYARALRVQDSTLEMVDQFNARRSDDIISAVLPLYDEGALQQIVFYVAASGEFQLLERDRDEVFRYRSTSHAGKIDLNQWYALDTGNETVEFIFAGDDRFWRLPSLTHIWRRVVEDSYETDLKNVHYSYLESADFDQNGCVDLIAVDGQRHVVEILVPQASGWESRMFWQVFEQNLHYQGRSGSPLEPRQIVVADLNSDGKPDFAFLAHDRILCYLQE